MYRVRGRRIYPSTLSERRVLMSLGAYPLYAPRGISPYLLARKLMRAAAGEAPELTFVRGVLAKRRNSQRTPDTIAEKADAATPSVAA